MNLRDRVDRMKQDAAEAKEAATPRGKAQAAWDAGDLVFQSVLVAVNAGPVLSEIASIGWQFASTAVAWIPGDTINISGLNTTSNGTPVGYYVFVRPSA